MSTIIEQDNNKTKTNHDVAPNCILCAQILKFYKSDAESMRQMESSLFLLLNSVFPKVIIQFMLEFLTFEGEFFCGLCQESNNYIDGVWNCDECKNFNVCIKCRKPLLSLNNAQVDETKIVIKTDIISRYNESYYCTVEKVEIQSNTISVHFHVRGNYSLGSLQDASYSKLLLLQPEKRPQIFEVFGSPVYEIYNQKREIKGILHYNAADCVAHRKYHFYYGSNGYSIEPLFVYLPYSIFKTIQFQTHSGEVKSSSSTSIPDSLHQKVPPSTTNQLIAMMHQKQKQRFSDEKENTITPSWKKKEVREWSVDDVTDWVNTNPLLTLFLTNFLDNRVDGTILINLTDEQLKNPLEIKNPKHRYNILEEIKTLKG